MKRGPLQIDHLYLSMGHQSQEEHSQSSRNGFHPLAINLCPVPSFDVGDMDGLTAPDNLWPKFKPNAQHPFSFQVSTRRRWLEAFVRLKEAGEDLQNWAMKSKGCCSHSHLRGRALERGITQKTQSSTKLHGERPTRTQGNRAKTA